MQTRKQALRNPWHGPRRPGQPRDGASGRVGPPAAGSGGCAVSHWPWGGPALSAPPPGLRAGTPGGRGHAGRGRTRLSLPPSHTPPPRPDDGPRQPERPRNPFNTPAAPVSVCRSRSRPARSTSQGGQEAELGGPRRRERRARPHADAGRTATPGREAGIGGGLTPLSSRSPRRRPEPGRRSAADKQPRASSASDSSPRVSWRRPSSRGPAEGDIRTSLSPTQTLMVGQSPVTPSPGLSPRQSGLGGGEAPRRAAPGTRALPGQPSGRPAVGPAVAPLRTRPPGLPPGPGRAPLHTGRCGEVSFPYFQ